MQRDGLLCCWCGVTMNLMPPTTGHPYLVRNHLACTIEHMKPKSQGGGNEMENLKLACARCNSTREARMGWNKKTSHGFLTDQPLAARAASSAPASGRGADLPP